MARGKWQLTALPTVWSNVPLKCQQGSQLTMKSIDHDRLDRLVLDAHKARDTRDAGYRERALKIYPWICGRCAREFSLANVRELTVPVSYTHLTLPTNREV